MTAARPYRFTAAMVLCDATWADPDENSSNGIDVKAQLDVLRLDSMIMMVQINIRQILQVLSSSIIINHRATITG